MIEHGRNQAEITIIDRGIVKEVKGRIISWLENGAILAIDTQLQDDQKLALRIFDVDHETSSLISSFSSDQLSKIDIEVQGMVENTDRDSDDAENWLVRVRFFGKMRMLRSAHS